MLNMPIEEIRSNISLREDYWEYDFDTNCYAFALGLDIGEYDICKNATNKPIFLLKNLLIYETIQLDLKVFKIGYSEISKYNDGISIWETMNAFFGLYYYF